MKRRIELSLILFFAFYLCLYTIAMIPKIINANAVQPQQEEYIKWVDFNIPASAMQKAIQIEIDFNEQELPASFIDLLACLGTKYGGNWERYRAADLDELADQLRQGGSVAEMMAENQYYSYYHEAYTAVLGEFVGPYEKEVPNRLKEGEKLIYDQYGLKVYFPIAEGFGYSHYDDFGSSRSYGYRRRHLGHDIMGSIGTPIVAIEGGRVEHLGWNQYGGWRIGIRSFDGKRYYYYAHLRRDHPYSEGLEEGDCVKSGQVIGYLGMTGYSTEENQNNMTTPHLHVGMQLIFHPDQEEENEIWIDLYQICKLLEQNKATVYRPEGSKEYLRKYDIFDPAFEEYFPLPGDPAGMGQGAGKDAGPTGPGWLGGEV